MNEGKNEGKNEGENEGEAGGRAIYRSLAEIAHSWGIALSDEQQAHFATYLNELQRWNGHTNLTAITEREDIITRHFLDSLWCARVWGDMPSTLVDIGSGAGFPGLPLKIAFPFPSRGRLSNRLRRRPLLLSIWCRCLA